MIICPTARIDHMIKIKSKKKTHRFLSKRQRGTEEETKALPYIHESPSVRNIAWSRFSIVLTIFFWSMYLTLVIVRQLMEGPNTYNFTLEVFFYLLVVTFLTFSALMYLVARHGALQRFSTHIRTPKALLDSYFSSNQPAITVLVPSYNEEPGVVRNTLLSAALQEYPKKRIVLLIDDDHKKIHPKDMSKYEETKDLSKDIAEILEEPSIRFRKATARAKKRNYSKISDIDEAIVEVIDHYEWAEKWLKNFSKGQTLEDHVDIFFIEEVIGGLEKDLRLVKEALLISRKENARLTKDVILHLYCRLSWIFNAELEVFERKKYISLSHEPNKAMNLNSYISLMGGAYSQVETPVGVELVPTEKKDETSIDIPDSDYLLTLDADSILLREYCLRLVYLLEQPDNSDVAVAQTPYSSFRGAPTRIERLAGATTDVQHILHQGMTYYNATFWVGANAIIRKKALEDIVEKEWIGGYEIKRYIQDHTVIEDTESSIDIAMNGWRLINYPERLSYSATPPDFGSLVVQRRRWANGGLIILPKLMTHVRGQKSKGESISKTEFLLRLNYMASIAWSNIGLVFLLAYPYDGRLLSPLVLLSALPYFISMSIDLKYCRYRYTDVIRIYGFNLILLPVNIAGVFKSLQQALTAKKIPFARTPKIKNRTAAGLIYVLSPLFIVGFSVFTLMRNLESQSWGNAVFAGFNALAALWAIVAYIGIGNLLVDLWLGFKDLFYVEVKNKKSSTDAERLQKLDWKAILYYGRNSGNLPYKSVNKLTVGHERS